MGRVVLTEQFKAALYVKRGVAAMQRNSFAEAIRHFDEALESDPDDVHAHWNRGTSLLSLGDYIGGFREFEWRWKMYDWRWGLLGDDIYRVRQLKPWRGENLTGKHLLFYWEMGYGDGIQQLRYVSLLHSLGAEVTALMLPPLSRLARSIGVEVIEKVPIEAHALFDYRCSLFGVMAALAQSVEEIPNKPYLPIPFEGGGGLGLCWSGRTQTEFDLSSFITRLQLPLGCVSQSLQPGMAQPFALPLPPGDFLDTAQLMAKLDHIVTVDTAVAHLAGAMGHPSAHVLIPYQSDWRWWCSRAWYPTLNIYRQREPGDWAVPFAMISKAIRSPQ